MSRVDSLATLQQVKPQPKSVPSPRAAAGTTFGIASAYRITFEKKSALATGDTVGDALFVIATSPDDAAAIVESAMGPDLSSAGFPTELVGDALVSPLVGGAFEDQFIGTGNPPPTLGGSGSTYFDVSSGAVWYNSYGVWTLFTSFSSVHTHSAPYVLSATTDGGNNSVSHVLLPGCTSIQVPPTPISPKSDYYVIVNNSGAPVTCLSNGSYKFITQGNVVSPSFLMNSGEVWILSYAENPLEPSLIVTPGYYPTKGFAIVGGNGAITGALGSAFFAEGVDGSSMSVGWGFDIGDNAGHTEIYAPGDGTIQFTGKCSFGSPAVIGSSTVAALPAGSEGMIGYATNGRKVGEGAGLGTGVPVYFSHGSWRVFSTDAAVAV